MKKNTDLFVIFPFVFHKNLLNALHTCVLFTLTSMKLLFSDCYCVFFYDREWWRQILSTTVRSLWQEPSILPGAQCVQFSDRPVLLCLDTFAVLLPWCRLWDTRNFVLTGTSSTMPLEVSETSLPLSITKQQAVFWLAQIQTWDHTLEKFQSIFFKIIFKWNCITVFMFPPLFLTDTRIKIDEEALHSKCF